MYIYSVYNSIPMTQVVRICRYGCNTILGDFDTKANKYREIDASKTLHTRERCESLKQGPKGLGNFAGEQTDNKNPSDLGDAVGGNLP